MAFTYSVVLNDPTNYGGATADAILVADMNAALQEWSHYIYGDGSLVISLNIVQTQVGRMDGASTTSYYAGAQNGLTLWGPSSLYGLTNGTRVSGYSSDITINVSPGYFQYLDLSHAMTYGSASAPNSYNPVYLFMHELFHGFGMSGWYSQGGSLPGGYESTFDALLNKTPSGTTYVGANGVAAAGGPIAITTTSTTQNYYHFGNTQSDLYQSPSTAADPLTLDLMNGIVFYYNYAYPVSKLDLGVLKDLGYTIVNNAHLIADFSDDGRSDVLFRNAAGVTYLWTMSNTTVAGAATTSVQVSNNWTIAEIGDFDGDGSGDILWSYYNASNAADGLNGVSYISFQNAATATGGGVVQQLGAVWQIAGAGDFNGDGMTDVLYRNTSTGQTFLDIMNGASVNWGASGVTSASVTNQNWKIAAIGDFNGDGKADVLWRYNNAANAADALNGSLYEWTMNGKSVTSAGALSQGAGSAWAVAGAGDFNGDGNADILFRNTSNGMTYIDFMNGTTVLGSSAVTQWQVDNSWVMASIGDYNGDGKADILWQQSSTGSMYVWDMNGAAVTAGSTTSAQPGLGWTVQNGALVG